MTTTTRSRWPDVAPTKVLYVTGWGRSGTTLIGRILGQSERFCDIGELRYLGQRLADPGWLCGCQQPLNECPFWQKVLGDSLPLDGIELDDVGQLRQEDGRMRQLPVAWARAVLRRPGPRYEKLLGRLYTSIRDASGASLVVDTSKYPSDAFIAAGAADVELYVLHLVRDPRAVAHSWSRDMPSPAAGDASDTTRRMRRRGPVYSSIWWLAVNASAMTMVRSRVKGRYLRMRYEDFVRDPERGIADIIEFVGEHPADMPFTSSHEVVLGPTHTVSGNPSRFKVGPVAIVADEEWRSTMPRSRRIAAVVAAVPLMRAMGYRLGRPRPTDRTTIDHATH